jgi:hypothetical protein
MEVAFLLSRPKYDTEPHSKARSCEAVQLRGDSIGRASLHGTLLAIFRQWGRELTSLFEKKAIDEVGGTIHSADVLNSRFKSRVGVPKSASLKHSVVHSPDDCTAVLDELAITVRHDRFQRMQFFGRDTRNAFGALVFFAKAQPKVPSRRILVLTTPCRRSKRRRTSKTLDRCIFGKADPKGPLYVSAARPICVPYARYSLYPIRTSVAATEPLPSDRDLSLVF